MSSPFASKVVVTLPVPFDPPHEVTIRKLAGRHLERARNVFLTGLFQDVQARGGAAVQKEMQQLFVKDAPDQQEIAEKVKKVEADPLNGFDKYVIAQAGLVAWTYPESLKLEQVVDVDGSIAMRCPAIDDLDEDTVEWIATEVMRLTKPALFQSASEAAADRKNG
jgi:hypothetical protein